MSNMSSGGATERKLALYKTPQLSFVIFASPKSGTTWMQRLLSAHPEVLCAESRPFGNYYHPNPLSNPHVSLQKYVSILNSYYAPMEPAFSVPDNQFEIAFNLLDTLGATALSLTGKKVYGEKLTPFRGTAMEVVEMLKRYNPALKFVHLTRDGRDVMVSGAAQWLNLRVRSSKTDAERNQWLQALEQRQIQPEDFENFIDLWTDAVSAGLHARNLFEKYLPLKYETLLENSAEEARKLLEFLGVDASPSVVNACVEAASFERLSGGRHRGAEDRNSFFRKGISGDWKNWFREPERKAFTERAGQLLIQAGYTV